MEGMVSIIVSIERFYRQIWISKPVYLMLASNGMLITNNHIINIQNFNTGRHGGSQ